MGSFSRSISTSLFLLEEFSPVPDDEEASLPSRRWRGREAERRRVDTQPAETQPTETGRYDSESTSSIRNINRKYTNHTGKRAHLLMTMPSLSIRFNWLGLCLYLIRFFSKTTNLVQVYYMVYDDIYNDNTLKKNKVGRRE